MSITAWVRQQIKEEFKDFQPDAGFRGGCKKTNCQGFCAHVKPDGTVACIEETCENYDICTKGQKFKYDVK
jgi:hypothetical protein